MKKYFLTLMIVPSIYFGQMKTQLDVFNNSRGKPFDVTDLNFKSYSGIDGSPYINENFLPIKIDGYQKLLPNARYNAYEDEMEYVSGNSLYYVEKMGEMRINFPSNKTYFLTHYNVDGKDHFGYLVELVRAENNKYSLYKKEGVQLLEYNNNTTNTYLKQKNPYFERLKDMYLITSNNIYTKFPKNIKELKRYLKNHNDQAQKFVNDEKINFNKENDIIKLINFLNSI